MARSGRTKKPNRNITTIVGPVVVIVFFCGVNTLKWHKHLVEKHLSSPRNNANNATSSTVKPPLSQENPLLNCTEITELEIVSKLGAGKQKVTYAVRLPNGQLGVAKRCHAASCVVQNLTINEGAIFRDLFEENGSQAIRFFGDCHGEPLELPNSNRYVQSVKTDFSVGHTTVVEMGRPLLADWTYNGSGIDVNCFAGFFTPADVDDLMTIAQRYARSSHGPILLGLRNQFTDNIFPQQYVLMKRTIYDGNVSHKVTSIQHGDVDMLYRCREHYGDKCTYEWSLGQNCAIIAKVVNRNLTDLDCENDLPSAVDPNAPRINTTLATLSCLI